VGSVFSRPGLVSIFGFATTLQITGYQLTYGQATFTYIGIEPTINEGWFLSGFSGPLSYLNGLEVFVEAVTMTQFTAMLAGFPDIGPITGLSGSAVSSTGLFVGPNIGSTAVGPLWTSPANISSPTLYASIASSMAVVVTAAPTSAVNSGTGNPWVNPGNAVLTGAPVATATFSFSPVGVSKNLLASGTNFSVPAGATVTGISVSVSAKYVGTGSGILNIQLANSGFPIGTFVAVPLSSTMSTYVKGSSAFQWGTTLTPAQVNGAILDILVQAGIPFSSSGTGTFSVNSLSVTVYYTTAAVAGALLDQGFGFSIPSTSGISGFNATFKAYSSASTSVHLQMLQSGVPVGTPKTVLLNTTPTLYNLGGPQDLWGNLWSFANVNSPTFGVQITASGVGTTFIGDLDITTFITTALENFNWVGTYEQNNMALTTLALDAAGILWKEDVINNPGVLSVALTGLLPDTFAVGATMNNQEFLMFSDLSIGTERPRLMDTYGNFYPVTQVGPGVPPSFQANTGSVGGLLNLTSFTWVTGFPQGTATFTYANSSPAPLAGALFVIAGTGTSLDGQVVIATGVPTTTTFAALVTGTFPAGPTNVTGTLTPSFSYSITSITQSPIPAGYLSPAPRFVIGNANQNGPGNVVSFYYGIHLGLGQDPDLVKAWADHPGQVFIQITGSTGSVNYNGVWQVTGIGEGRPTQIDQTIPFLTFNYSSSHPFNSAIQAGASYEQTIATMVTATPIPSLVAGSPITITNATNAAWNGTWKIVKSVNTAVYTITSTTYDYVNNLAVYGWSAAPGDPAPTVDDLIAIIGCTNNAVFNGTFIIHSVSGSTFTVAGIVAPAGITSHLENAQGAEYGSKFTFDPGETLVNQSVVSAIFPAYTGGGLLTQLGTTLVPIGAGTRQAIVFFITQSGNWTPASPPVQFDVPADANLLNVSGIPIGPSNVIARGIAITEAGANGVPGANFYVIVNPVVNPLNGATYTSTIIHDNTTQSASFSFTDAVLLNSLEIDVQGNNLFNLIELGSPAWCVPYSSRMFYGMMLNKVDNFNNLSFDGGYVIPNQPAGWGLYPTANEFFLVNSPVTLSALYISNTTGSIQSVMGQMSQTAYQDPYKVAIIKPNTAYSVRVACSCPSGIRLGTLVIDLVDLSGGQFSPVSYGSFSVPLSSMGTNVSVFSGTLLAQGIFPGVVSPNLQLRVRVINMGIGADVLIDRIEVFPTKFPFLKTEVFGSYINKPESIDTSGDGGIIDTSTENAQTCVGGFVLRDQLYLMKINSLYSTRDNPNSEPGGWSLIEVSNRSGAIGIHAFDTGDEWAVMANRSGIYGFTGGIPLRLTEEIFQVWEAINWDAGDTIVLRNDTVNRRLLCAIPLPTGTDPVTGVKTKSVKWLPNAPYNPAPTTPNLMLICNYQSLGTPEEFFNSPEMHTTMLGNLAVQDMKRKWTVWQIPSPYLGFVTRRNYNDIPLMICNGIHSSKIYELDPEVHNDDGAAIYSLYTTYGHVNAIKATTMPIFGMHTKRFTILQVAAEGNGAMLTRMLPNDLNCRYPYKIPIGINLDSPVNDDYFRSINCKGQRMFLEFSTNAVDSWFKVSKSLLTGKADPHSSLNPTGGGNAGII